MTAREVIRAAHALGVTIALHGSARIQVTSPEVVPPDVRQALLEACEECAGILEYGGRLERSAAEALAWQHVGISTVRPP